MKTKQQYYDAGFADFKNFFKHNNRSAKARVAYYNERLAETQSWQSNAYVLGYRAAMAEFDAQFAKVEQQVRDDHQDKLSDYAVKRIAQHRVVREAANNDSATSVQAFKQGDKVFIKASPKYVGVVQDNGNRKGDRWSYNVRFTGSEGAGYDVYASAYENEIELHDSVPCVPYTWEGHSHTANQLFWAKSERKRAEVGFRAEDWHSWDDEARYLAGVIIGSYDATIYG